MGIFNRQRNTLIDNNKTVKYLKYAVGEILIITIGIFIAIQFNNWNERRKAQNEVEDIFNETQSNLKVNQERIKPLIQWYDEKDSLVQLVKDKRLSRSDYNENKELLTLINFYGRVQIEKNGYLKLGDYLNEVPSKYDSILPNLNVLYNQIVPMADRYELVMENFNHRMHERWALDYEWFSEPRDLSNEEERIEHFLNSPEYQNDVRLYSMYSTDNYVSSLKYVDTLSGLILKNLRKVKAGKNGS